MRRETRAPGGSRTRGARPRKERVAATLQLVVALTVAIAAALGNAGSLVTSLAKLVEALRKLF